MKYRCTAGTHDWPLAAICEQRASDDLARSSKARVRVATPSRTSSSMSSRVRPKQPQIGAVRIFRKARFGELVVRDEPLERVEIGHRARLGGTKIGGLAELRAVFAANKRVERGRPHGLADRAAARTALDGRFGITDKSFVHRSEISRWFFEQL